MNSDKAQEYLSDAIGEGMSDCCSARVYDPSGESAICANCQEYCLVIHDTELPEPLKGKLDLIRKEEESI